MTSTQKAVFVVGAPRSGTSIVWLALRRALQATAYGEGHMMPFFATRTEEIIESFIGLTARRYTGMLAAETEPEDLERQYAEMVRRFYDEAYRGSHIVDKTPGLDGVRCVPFVMKVFPSALIVFCHRRALENVESRLRKWPQTRFESHCREWKAIMSTWRSLRDELPDQQYREVDQQLIVIQPQEIARSLAEMIDIDEEGARLMAETFRTKEASMIEGSTKERVLRFETVDWDAKRKKTFLDICGDELTAWGYGLDDPYRELSRTSPSSSSRIRA